MIIWSRNKIINTCEKLMESLPNGRSVPVKSYYINSINIFDKTIRSFEVASLSFGFIEPLHFLIGYIILACIFSKVHVQQRHVLKVCFTDILLQLFVICWYSIKASHFVS